ncbi:aminoglycoside phosphotransferase [Halorussus sp. MSC15.2]|uniref:aminoglycoside phosphotransferase n=1 Tax=Halorussus sp. MSC15.2 TaxID=2283638 RepID=UPI0013D11B87|nr:aminoglycoside phosphotransferase [Halorussus sp. MSC15.2]NEU56015.1 aminoglycoside phosphotransferase [Halorussus sp. MSC15.2]
MKTTEEDSARGNSLAQLRLGLQIILAIAFVVLFVVVGATPGKWGLPLGITLAAFSVYWMFRDRIERHLTGPQEWGLFALSGVLVVVAAIVENVELTDEMVLSIVSFLGVSVIFGYRAVKSR